MAKKIPAKFRTSQSFEFRQRQRRQQWRQRQLRLDRRQPDTVLPLHVPNLDRLVRKLSGSLGNRDNRRNRSRPNRPLQFVLVLTRSRGRSTGKELKAEAALVKWLEYSPGNLKIRVRIPLSTNSFKRQKIFSKDAHTEPNLKLFES